jgi:hypothetical protein
MHGSGRNDVVRVRLCALTDGRVLVEILQTRCWTDWEQKLGARRKQAILGSRGPVVEGTALILQLAASVRVFDAGRRLEMHFSSTLDIMDGQQTNGH